MRHILLILVVTALATAGLLGTVDASNPCPDQRVHTYGAVAAGTKTLLGPSLVSVIDTNTSECDGDANTTADWDGDYDAGGNGGFFGYGAWAEDPDCNYALNIHGPNVAVSDLVFGSAINFVVGEDDQSGPIKIWDPNSGWICTTSGVINPCPDNDPLLCGPTDDPDDCLSQMYVGTGQTCGAGGGDGGYWVIHCCYFYLHCEGFPLKCELRLVCLFVDVDVEIRVAAGNPPTTGTITAY